MQSSMAHIGVVIQHSKVPFLILIDDNRNSASGNCNGASINNRGTNGNYWSSSLNVSNPYNAYNLNFNSESVNPQNNNNRYIGRPVRGVLVSEQLSCNHNLVNKQQFIMSYILTKEQLLVDLYLAFECAKQHKKHKSYVLDFESKLHDNLLLLCNDLYNHTYTPQPSSCFIITHPKKREVFAANFRDRIVHHLYFNYTHEMYERTFIQDSYSCIKNRGTHYGIHRLEKHIRQESHNYADNCYILKMDIKGYFMSINRNILLKEANKTLNKMRYHKIYKWDKRKWNDMFDFEFLKYLTREIVLLDPTIDCIFKSQRKAWNDLSNSKSLFKTPKECGLPIGNLTSQLFSNVYLNALDQFMKRELHCRHYGRYVDDFFVVCKDKHYLHKIIASVEQFMHSELKLLIQKGKTMINSMWQGVEFLGAYIKPYRTYISNQCLRRIKKNLFQVGKLPNPIASVNSWLGIFSHYHSFNLRVGLFTNIKQMFAYGVYSMNYSKFVPMEKWEYGV